MKTILKSSLTLVSLLFINLTFAQNELEKNPSLLGAKLGDDFIQWKSKVKYEGSKGDLDKYNYIMTESKTIAGVPIENVSFFFNANNNELEGIVIVSKKFKNGVMEESQIEPVLNFLKNRFGTYDSADNTEGDFYWFWKSPSYELSYTYSWGGDSLGQYKNFIYVMLSTKAGYTSTERL